MSAANTGRAGRAGASAGTVWERQADGYHRFFSQFTIPLARPLLDAARVTAGGTVLDAAAGTAELARALAPGGWLAVSIWDDLATARHTGLLADAVAEVTGSPPAPAAVAPGGLTELVQAAGLGHAECSTLRWVHPVTSAQALWDGLLASPVAAAITVRRATPATQHRIHERFLTLAAALTDRHGTVRLPVSAVIAAGQRPPAARRVSAHGGQRPPALPGTQ